MQNTAVMSKRLLYINLVAFTVNALLFFALVLKLWLPLLLVAVGIECFIGLIRLSWSVQKGRTK